MTSRATFACSVGAIRSASQPLSNWHGDHVMSIEPAPLSIKNGPYNRLVQSLKE